MRRTVSIARLSAGVMAAGAAALLAACGGGDKVSGPAPSAPPRITLSSPAFAPGQTIPQRFTCDGAGVSPPLRWSRVPRDARSLALLVEDPDAPGGTFVHWTAWAIPPTTVALGPGAKPPRQGENRKGETGWTPPCPPGGKAHRYVFTLYALRAPIDLDSGAKPGKVRDAIGRDAIGQGSLTGRF